MSGALEGLKAALAAKSGTNAEDWYPVFKARQGMAVAFQELARSRDEAALPTGEVATQLFTCCTAVDPIVVAGLKPVYGDISPRTLGLDPRQLPVSERTCAVMIQHTYGIQDRKADRKLATLAHQAGALALEDCAHCVGRLSRDAEGRPIADVSFHSFGVEKMLPTHFGGAVWLNPAMEGQELRARIAAALTALPEVDARRAKAAREYRNQIRVIGHLPGALGKGLRQRLEKAGRFEPAISTEELAGGLGSAPALPDAWVAQTAATELGKSGETDDKRCEDVAAFAEAFRDLPGAPAADTSWVCAGGTDPAQPLLRFGLFAPNAKIADTAVVQLRSAGCYAVPWYRPVLFPGITDPAAYGMPAGVEPVLGQLPVTFAASRGAVSLPTDLGPERTREVAQRARQFIGL